MKKVILAASVVILATSCTNKMVSSRDIFAADPECVMLTINGDPATCRAVTWRTEPADTASIAQIVAIDGSPESVEKAVTVQGSHTPWEEGAADYKMGHEVSFKNLTPKTTYAYRVGNGEDWSEWFQFKTSSDKAEPFSFLYYGDVQNDIKSMASRILRQSCMHFPESSFMLFAGDLVGRSERDYWDEFFYAGSWLFGTIPSMPIAGNHEYYKNAEPRPFSKHWNQIYSLPTNTPSEAYQDRLYYIDYQGVRFIGVDAINVKYEEDGAMITSWLESALESNPCKWSVVFMHYPVYSCSQGRDSEGFRAKLLPIFEKYGVDLVLQGHDHTYCRGFNPQPSTKECKNPPMYVVSVSGPKMYGLNVSLWADRVASNTQLYQHISFDADTLDFQTYDVSGELYDSFKLIKTESGRNEFILDPRVEDIKMNTTIQEDDLEDYDKDELKEYNDKLSKMK